MLNAFYISIFKMDIITAVIILKKTTKFPYDLDGGYSVHAGSQTKHIPPQSPCWFFYHSPTHWVISSNQIASFGDVGGN